MSYTLLNNAGDGIFLAVHACGMVRKKSIGIYTAVSVRRPLSTLRSFTSRLLAFVSIFGSLGWAQQPAPDWQTEVQKYAQAQDWSGAMRIVDREIARAPHDMDVRAWRARVLAWSGHLAEAEREYREIIASAPNDPDTWMGLAGVYSGEGQTEEALRALDRAVELDPRRADLRVARARVFRATGNRREAKREFQRALDLDPGCAEARAGLPALQGEAKHELRFGWDTDLFSFANANRGEWMTLVSRWSSHWTTSLAGNFYQRGGADAGKLVGSVTGRRPQWGALTLGGATGRDNGVIPKSEAFFEYGHGWRVSESALVRGVEVAYGQHWYWYTTARILTVNGTTVVYLPRQWTWSFGLTGARSRFPGTRAEWRPSGVTRLGFPVAGRSERQLRGNVFFAVGTENFGQVDQIGQFSSQIYGGGLRFQWTTRQDVTGYAAFQQRTQDRAQTSFGFTYGIRF